MPASSPCVSSMNSTLKPCFSAQRVYMRNNIRAQSWLSVPPAPAWTSRKLSLASASPDNSASACRRSACAFNALSAASASATTLASCSASPSSIMVRWSSSSCSMREIAPKLSSSAVRSCITFWARSWSFHRSESSACRLSSASRALDLSKSKMPPQQPDGLLDGPGCGLHFCAHGRSSREFAGRCARETIGPHVATGPAQGNVDGSVKPTGSRTDRPVGFRRHPARIVGADRPAVGIGEADDGIAVRRSGARLERFDDDFSAPAGAGAQPGLRIDADQLDAGRRREIHARLVDQRHLQEVLDDGGGKMTARRAAREMPRLVIADVHADGQVRGVADEPRILLVIGGAGLAGNRLPDLLDHRRGATLDHALEHPGDLEGGHRIEDLLAPVDQNGLRLLLPLIGIAAAAFALVVAIDGVAVAILDAIDEGRLDALA